MPAPSTQGNVVSNHPSTERLALLLQFPIEFFPAELQRYAQRTADSLQTPIDFVGVAMLTVAGSAIGNSRVIRVRDEWSESPNLMSVLIGPPADGKTPVIRQIVAPVIEADTSRDEEYKDALKQFKKAGNAASDPPNAPVFTRVSDVTPQALIKALAQNPRGILHLVDEGVSLFRSLCRAGASEMRSRYLSCWSNAPIRVDRISNHEPTIVNRPILSLLTGIQPEVLQQYRKQLLASDGLLDRLLFAQQPGRPFPRLGARSEDFEPDSTWAANYRFLIGLQPTFHPESGLAASTMHFSDPGYQAFQTFVNALADRVDAGQIPSQLRGFVAKLRSHTARFCLILHFLKMANGETTTPNWGEGTIDEDTVQRSSLLAEYFLAQTRLVVSNLSLEHTNNDISNVVEWMKGKGRSHYTPRDLQRAEVGGIKTAKEAKKLLDQLAGAGLGSIARSGTKIAFTLSQ